MILKKLITFFHPERFQGWGKKRSYFEGWYYKFLSADTTNAFALIPGIAYDEFGKGHAFIQVLDGKRNTSVYHRFSSETFSASPGELSIGIGNNKFTDSKLKLDLPELKGELHFPEIVGWPKPFYSPGIMGPYSFAPFMECYHGIVSMDHAIKGSLSLNDKIINFDGGRGYIEKDWGRSFPSAYVWIQSNHFKESGISLKTSVAKIPWMKSSFTGFIAGLWFNQQLYRFTTYNGTKLKNLQIHTDQIELKLENSKFILELTAFPDKAASLASPVRGAMDGKIEESMSSRVEVKLIEKKSRKTIFHDTGFNAGLEVAGNIEEIITKAD